MKTLSIKQPFAHLIAIGLKDIASKHWILKNAIMFKNPILNVNGKLSLWHYDLPEGWFSQ